MTPQEQQLIDGLINRIRNTRVENKDTDAEQHIQQGLAGVPDALYVLAQTVIVQQYGLQQAQTQIQQLQQQIDESQAGQNSASGTQTPGSSGGFLSHLFGGGNNADRQPAAPAQPPYQPVNTGYAQGGYPPPPPAYPPQGYPQGGFGGGGFGGGGFLSGALQTAAGVAAGEAVFQGMEDLFHGFGRGGGGSPFGGGGFGQPGGETVINNYYDDDNRGGESRGDDRRDDSNFYNPSDDASRQSDAPQFADAGSDNQSFDDNSNSGFDDGGNSGNDDSPSFDDSGSNDFGGGSF